MTFSLPRSLITSAASRAASALLSWVMPLIAPGRVWFLQTYSREGARLPDLQPGRCFCYRFFQCLGLVACRMRRVHGMQQPCHHQLTTQAISAATARPGPAASCRTIPMTGVSCVALSGFSSRNTRSAAFATLCFMRMAPAPARTVTGFVLSSRTPCSFASQAALSVTNVDAHSSDHTHERVRRSRVFCHDHARDFPQCFRIGRKRRIAFLVCGQQRFDIAPRPRWAGGRRLHDRERDR